MKKFIILSAVALGMSLASCNEILDRPQLNTPTDENFWKTEADLRMYAFEFYPYHFIGYNSGWASTETPVRGITFADDFTTTGTQSSFLSSTPKSVGSTAYSNYLGQTGGQSWDFGLIRKANIMLDRMNDRMKNVLAPDVFAHWYAVGEFFKAYEYWRLVVSFGDVPYFEHEVGASQLDELYKDRDPRNTVMDKVYDLCKDVMANMREDDGPNRLNRYVAAGFITRMMLFEGTWQKYHNNDATRAKKFLDFAIEAGNYVINSGKYSIATPMHELFGSQNLAGNNEVLLYRHYDDALAVRHCIASYCNGKEGPSAVVNLQFMMSVICNDGKPWKKSSVEGANSFELRTFAKSRDPRFESQFDDAPNRNCATYIYGNKFVDRACFERPEGDTNPLYESVTNTNDAPIMRYGEILINWIEAKAEAATVGGTAVTQDDLDKSVTALRARPLDATAIEKGLKQTAPMKLSDITADFDPDRDADVDPLIWEIRRERRLERVFEVAGRILDIRRWKKLDYMNNEKYPATMLGCWIDFNNCDYDRANTAMNPKISDANKGITTVMHADPYNIGNGTKVTFDGNNKDQMVGFYVPQNIKPRSVFSDRNYLYPVGTQQIGEYTKKGYTLTQTKGWDAQ